jgi:hypothetical protein
VYDSLFHGNAAAMTNVGLNYGSEYYVEPGKTTTRAADNVLTIAGNRFINNGVRVFPWSR